MSNQEIVDDLVNRLRTLGLGTSLVEDASSSVKGVVRLSGDLAGTASSPTVPSLAEKYAKPGGGIPKADLATPVQTSLDKADSALQSATVDTLGQATTVGKALMKAAAAVDARSAISAPDINDSRFTDQRTPSDGSVTNAKVSASAAIALSKLATGYVQGQRNGTATTTRIDALTEAQYAAIGSKDSNTLYFAY